MPRVEPFDRHVSQYEAWFERHRLAYESELEAVRAVLPRRGTGVEIGIGTGRFAEPLGIRLGIEPSQAMREVARSRGLDVVEGVAEALPWDDGGFDFALLVTTICFVDDIGQTFREACRVIRPGGHLIVGFVDRESVLGRIYERHKANNAFYRVATFYSTDEVIAQCRGAGLTDLVFRQTIFREDLDQMTEVEPVKEGHGEGSFVVLRGKKPMVATSDP